MSAIANDGVLMTPRVLDRTENYTGTLVERYEPQEYGSLLTSEEAENLKEYLRAVVTDGTGSALQTDSYTVYGKTGTAEYSTIKKQPCLVCGMGIGRQRRSGGGCSCGKGRFRK